MLESAVCIMPGVVRDSRHEKAGLHLVKEIHRVAHHLAEELGADVGQHFVLTQFM